MEEVGGIRYNLGCGKRKWPGWIGVDLGDNADLKSDLRQLPIESDSADAVAAIHVLEHFYYWEAPALITEWRRILKPGGKMILELPCLDKIIDYLSFCCTEKQPLLPFMSIHALYGDDKHKDPLMCHKFAYMQEILRQLLEQCGMREIQSVTPRYHFAFRDMRFEAIK